MFWSFTVREGRAVYFQSGGLEAGKTAVLFFMPEHGLRPGWTAVAGGGPKEVAVLLGWGVFHEEEGGVCPLSVSIQQYACHVYQGLSDKPVFPRRPLQTPSPPGRFREGGAAAFIPSQQKTGDCLIFIRRPLHMPKKQAPPGSRKKEDRRGRRRSSEEEVWDVGMSWRLLSGRRGLYIFSQGGLEAGKTDVLFFLCRSTASGRAGPPWQTAVLEVRCLVQVLFMRRGFEKPPALYKANCMPLFCGMYCPAGTGKVPGHSPPVCVFLSSIQTLSSSLYKKHTEISRIL